MTGDTPSHLVPKLRFPEFRDDPPWLAPAFADLYSFKRTYTLSRDKLNYVTGAIRNIHYGDIHTKFSPLFKVGDEYVPYVNPDASANGFDDDAFCEEGDIVLADASEDLDDVGKAIEVVSLNGERVVAGTHTILATRRGSVPVVGFGGATVPVRRCSDRDQERSSGREGLRHIGKPNFGNSSSNPADGGRAAEDNRLSRLAGRPDLGGESEARSPAAAQARTDAAALPSARRNRASSAVPGISRRQDMVGSATR